MDRRVRWAAYIIGGAAAILAVLIFIAILFPGKDTWAMAYKTQMVAELTSLRGAEQKHLADSARFTADVAALEFAPTTGLTLSAIALGPSGSSWAATVRHQKTPVVCGIGVRRPNPLGAAGDGVVICK